MLDLTKYLIIFFFLLRNSRAHALNPPKERTNCFFNMMMFTVLQLYDLKKLPWQQCRKILFTEHFKIT